MQHRIDGLADRHLDIEPSRQFRDNRGGRHALDNRPPAGELRIEIMPATETKPERKIARLDGAAGKHEISYSGKTSKSLGAPALSAPQPYHLGEPAGDQRGSSIFAQSPAENDPARDCQHVLDGAADFRSRGVIRQIG